MQHIKVNATTHGDGFANSGILFDPPDGPAPHSFKVTFTQPGTYQLECEIHPNMDATVIVRPLIADKGRPVIDGRSPLRR